MLFPEMIQYLLVASFGLAIGSFLNVIIYRLPRGESIVYPSSHCPNCGASIRFYDNIPIFGYLFLRGKCRACGTGISLRYPLIECISGCMFVTLFSLHGLTLPFISQAIFGSILLAAVVIDLQHMIVPNNLMLVGGIFGILTSLAFGWAGVLRAFSGALAGLAILGAIAGIGWLLYRRESIGQGDFKLVAVTGLFLGPLFNSIALILAVFIGGFWGIALLITGKNISGREIPFVPFIAAGCYGVMFFGGKILILLKYYMQIYWQG